MKLRGVISGPASRLQIAPLVLSLVAFGQLALAQFGTLSPWKGGGFGMFATLDSPSNRSISVVAFDNLGGAHTVNLPWGRFSAPTPLTVNFGARLTTFPTRGRLLQLAEAVLNAHLLPYSGEADVLPTLFVKSPYRTSLEAAMRKGRQLEVVGPYRTADSVKGIREVEASVVGVRFDVRTGSVVYEPIGTTASVFDDGTVH